MKSRMAMKIGFTAGALLLGACGSGSVSELDFLANGSASELTMYYPVEGETDGMFTLEDDCTAYAADAQQKLCEEDMETAAELLEEVQSDLKEASFSELDTDQIDENQLAYYFAGSDDDMAYFYRDGNVKVITGDGTRTAYTCDQCADIIEACDDAVEELNENNEEYEEALDGTSTY